MLTYKEFNCWIEIEGEEAKEYEVRQSQDPKGIPTVTCWIASEAGKHFTVNWKDSVAATDAGGFVYVDGKYTHDSVLGRSGRVVKKVTRGFRTSESEVRHFTFSPIQFTDDDHYLGNSISEGFGEIAIHIKRCTVGETFTPQKYDDFSEQTLHERSKKAMVHRVSAGASSQSITTYFNCSNYIDVVKFIFKYRTLDQLIANDIAPRPSRPPKRKGPADDDEVIEISDDSGDEEAQLKARLAEIQAKRAKKKIKKEHLVNKEDVKPVLF